MFLDRHRNPVLLATYGFQPAPEGQANEAALCLIEQLYKISRMRAKLNSHFSDKAFGTDVQICLTVP